MALVKKSKVNNTTAAPARRSAPPAKAVSTPNAPQTGGRRNATNIDRRQQAAERISAAAGQLATGISQTAVAAEELQRSMDQVTVGAEEASGSAQESLRAITEMSRGLALARENAEISQNTIRGLQALVHDVSGTISDAISNVETAAERQLRSVEEVAELEKQVEDIGEIGRIVANIADQTNLLALNAAIEAARAGRHGKGFGAVADEVRNQAEGAESSAREIQDLVAKIKAEVATISKNIGKAAEAATDEVKRGVALNEQLNEVRKSMQSIAKAGEEVSILAQESASASAELQKGAEAVAAAAEEQAAACEESARMINEQSIAMSEGSKAAQQLAKFSEDLHAGTNVERDSVEVAAIAEELSAAIEEINRAAAQIKIALNQISKGAQQQSVAAEESAAAANQIEKGTRHMDASVQQAIHNGTAMLQLLQENRRALEAMNAGILSAVTETRRSWEQAKVLEQLCQRIDKIVNAIANISIQTNMLAVSGRIEAARSGEHGKGFVVVSADIRNLSRDSAEHVERIKDLVLAVQGQIRSVRATLEEITTTATAEVAKTQRTLTSFETVEAEMQHVQTRIADIAANATTMLNMVDEIKRGTEQIAAVATEADLATQEAATAADQQSKGAEELAAAIEEIASLADSLRHT